MKRHLHCAEQQVSRSNLTKYCACHAERLAYFVLITYKTSCTVRGTTGVTIQPHQIRRLSRRKTHILSPHHIWNVIYTARSIRSHDPTSPNTAPVTKNDSTALSSSHMKRHFQCAEQQVSLSNLTKYCACHEKWHCKISKKISKNRWNVISNAEPIRAWSDHDPRMKTQTATRLATEVTFRAHHEHFLLKNTPFRAQSYIQTFTKYCACHEKCHLNFTKYCACHEKWHLNFTKYCACHEKWHLNFTKYCACHEKWHLNFTKYCTCHEKWHLNFTKYCACHEKWHLNFTKYCTCHEKWHLNFTKYCACHAERLTYLVLIAYETSFTVRGATGVTIQPHQILRLPRKMTRLLYRPHIWNVISYARSNRCHYPTSPNTAPATKNDTARFQRKSPKTGETSFPMRSRSEHDPTMIREWSENENANRNPPRNRGYFSSSPRAFSIEKYNVSRPILHSNLHQILRLPRKVPLELHQILRLPRKVPLELHQVLRLPRKVTLELHQVLRLPRKVTLELHQVYCTCHEKWHLNFTKYCACHEKWHLNFTKYCACHCTVTELYCTLLYLTLLYLTLLYLTLLYVTLLYLALLYLLLFYMTLLYLTYSTWFYSTWHYSTWPTLLDLLYLILLCLTLLYLTFSTWLYSTWHHSTWHYSTWLYSTCFYSTWLYSTWPTLLDSTLLDTTLLDLLYLTLLYLTLLYLTLFYLTLLYLTLLYLTLLYLTLLYLTLLYLT